MKVEIKLFANLKKLLPPHAEGSAATIEVEDGLTVAELIEQLQIPKEMAQLVLVNGVNIEGEQEPSKRGIPCASSLRSPAASTISRIPTKIQARRSHHPLAVSSVPIPHLIPCSPSGGLGWFCFCEKSLTHPTLGNITFPCHAVGTVSATISP
jgi:sulfur carrier protein ThiS